MVVVSETAILAAVTSALFGICLSLVAVVWSTLKERNKALEARADRLEAQNTAQEVTLGRLTEIAKAREEAHENHREDMANAVSRLEASIAELGRKLDRMAGQGTPYPGRYPRPGESGDRK